MTNNNTYTISYRCTNCGAIYEKEVQKGLTAEGRGGECPTCGIHDGEEYPEGMYLFIVIKENDIKHYYP
jgi:DNA-directed RNA polymerase subunit RPC12/RpoP